MNWNSSHSRGARLIASILVASTMGLATVASASAHSAPPTPITHPAHGRGVTLDQARSAIAAAGGLTPKFVGSSAGKTLEGASTLAIRAVFIAPAHVLAVVGTTQNDTITVSRDVAGKLLVNGGAVRILGPAATVANTSLIDVFGLEGNDNLGLDEANGALPNADLFGGAGDDTLIGGSGSDQLFGESGNDTSLGKGGTDLLSGGSGNDTLTGGAGDDQVFGESGDDRLIWNPGDGTDLNEGGDGTDTIEVNGGNGAEVFSVVPNGTRVRFDRVTPRPFSLDIGTAESLVVNMNGGDDTFTGSNGLAGLIQLTVDGGPGNDTITGGDGGDRLIGGDGNDTIIGGRGADTALMGDGDDVFVWNPGDGSDVVEGQAGNDTLLFNGANVGEKFDFSANGPRLRFARDVGAIVMDTDGVEKVSLNELGGTDLTTVNDLTGTAVTELDLNLAATGGGGDGAIDAVIVNATSANDAVILSGAVGSATVLGLNTTLNISGTEVTDSLHVNGLAGDDAIEASGVGAGSIGLVLSGGDGDDVLIGGAGDDQLLGDAGDDLLIGGLGQDALDGGTGNNTLIQ